MTVAVVAGAIANKLHYGGEAWVRLSWALGLASLGMEVHLLERIDAALVDAERIAYFRDVAEAFGLMSRASLVDSNGVALAGPDSADVVAASDLLINISGHLPLDGPAGRAPARVYVDVDPGYTQLWAAAGQLPNLAGHHLYVTVGLAVGSLRCALPTGGVEWVPTLPPVVLAEWPAQPQPDELRFTTVTSWRGGYGRMESHGTTYGQKAHEFRKLIELPRRSPQRFELALRIDLADDADRTALLQAGWRLVDPLGVAADPDAYRRYIQGSAAECSAAQGIYVDTACGWFSDRTAHYLASGRPALVQHTGTGLTATAGLVTFDSIDEAVRGVEAIVRDYEQHAEGARAFAVESLDSQVVLSRLLERLPTFH